jgi:hypothetical protein
MSDDSFLLLQTHTVMRLVAEPEGDWGVYLHLQIHTVMRLVALHDELIGGFHAFKSIRSCDLLLSALKKADISS